MKLYPEAHIFTINLDANNPAYLLFNRHYKGPQHV